MGLFFNRGYPHNEEEAEYLLSTLPGFTGIGHHEYTYDQALANSDIFTAVMSISSDLAKMDILVKNDNVHDPAHPIEALLNKKPNNIYDGYTFKFIVFANALLTKHGYVEIVRDNKNQPVELYHLKTSQVELKQKDNRLYYLHKGEREINYADVIDYKPYSLDGVDGLSMLSSLTPDLEMQKHSKSFFANFFKHGTQAGGLLKIKGVNLSKEAREKLRDEFQKANSGADNAGKVLVLDDSMDFDKFEIDTEILKLINTSQHSTAQVAKVFGIPLHKFGIETSNMSLKDSMADYLQSTLSTYMKGITSVFEFKLFPRSSRTIQFDTETYRKVDWGAYTETVSKQYNDGVITLNEYRRKIGEPPVEGAYGDKHRVSLNLVDAEIANTYQEKMADNRLKGGVNNGEGN